MSGRLLGWALLAAGIAIVAVSGAALLTPGGDGRAASSPSPVAAATPSTAPTTAATPDATLTPSPDPTPDATPTPDPTAAPVDEQAVEAFIASLVVALREGDATFQVASLHPAVLARYGEDQCRTELPKRADPTVAVAIRSIGDLEVWDWTTDDVTTLIEDTIPVDTDIVIDGTSNRQTLHLAAREDGTIVWFTDCGTPLEATPSP